MTGLTRRRFAQSTACGVAGLAAGTSFVGTTAQAQPAIYDVDAMAAEISARLFAAAGPAWSAPERPTVCDIPRGLVPTIAGR